MHLRLSTPRGPSLLQGALRLALVFFIFLVCLHASTRQASAQAPSAPTNLLGMAGNQRVNLSWTAVSGATSYTVLRGTATGGPYSTTVISGLTATNYSNTGLTNGTAYYYVVQAVSAGGTSVNSNQASATPNTALAAPTNLVATGQTGQVTLSWTAVSGAVGYNIYRWISGAQPYAPTYSSVTSNPYVDSGRTNGTSYFYVITAVGSNGSESTYTGSVVATPAAQPTGLTARAGNTQVTLSWSAATGATRYNVYRGTTSNGQNATPIATLNDHSLTYTDTGLTNGQTYYYKVTGANGANGYGSAESTSSAEASATPLAALPQAPTGLNAIPGNHQVILSWNSVASATSYNVKRSTTFGQGYTTLSSPTSAGYTDTTALNATTYYYVVTAVNASGEGANSAQVSATPQTASGTNGLTTIADAHTMQATPTVNNGYSATLYTGNPTGSRYISYYKFDLSGAGGAITSATLKLTGGFVNTGNPSITSDNFSVYAVSDNSWTELGINWNNQPTLGSLLDTKSISTGTSSYNWNVTSFVQSQQSSGVGQVTLAVAMTTTPTVNNYATFFPREASANWPTLVVTVGAPVAPTLSATGGYQQVSLSWTAAPGATSYTLSRAAVSGGPYTVVTGGSGLTGTSFVDTGLTANTTYYYVVSATNSNGVSANSNQAAATTTNTSVQWAIGYQATAGFAAAPNLIDGPMSDTSTYYEDTVTTGDYRKLTAKYDLGAAMAIKTVNFTGKVSYPGGTLGIYSIDYSTDGTTWTVAKSGTTASFVAGAFYTLSTSLPTAVSARYWRISLEDNYYAPICQLSDFRLFDASGSPVGSALATPSAPTNLTATARNAQVVLRWNGDGVSSYNIKRYTVSGGPYASIGTSSTSNYIDSGVTNGTPYYYVVTATNNAGTSGNSNQATATPNAAVLPAPSVAVQSVSSGSVSLVWCEVLPAVAYNVYRSTAPGSLGAELPYATVIPSTINYDPTTTDWTDSQAANGSTYYYKVTAVTSAGEGALSNEVSASPPTAGTADFVLRGRYATITVPVGGSAGTAFEVYRVYGFNNDVNLTTLDVPVGVLAYCAPNLATNFGNLYLPVYGSNVIVDISSSMAPGTYYFTVKGVSGGLSHSLPIRLIVTP
jgi:fibronectin type 3 domain-containing protein